MKKLLKYLCCLTLLFTLSLSLVGCTNDNKEKNDNGNNNDGAVDTNDFDEIDTTVNNQFGNNYELNRKDVVDATNYIKNNLDNVKDKEVAKKLYEKGSFLETAANNADVGDDDSIRNLGIRAKNYAKRVYYAKDGEVENVISKGKSDFDEFKDKFDEGVDKAVDDFMSFFEGKKTEH